MCWALIAAGACLGGCARTESTDDLHIAMTPSLLFGDPADGLAATSFDRPAWPSAAIGFASPEYSSFVEFYQDYQGSPYAERNTPRRWFTSRRFGTQQR